MIATKEFIALHANVAREIEARELRVSKIEICPEPVSPSKPRPGRRPPLPRPIPGPDPAPDDKRLFVRGSMTLFIARPGTRAMDELRAALAKGQDAVAKLLGKYQKAASDRQQVSIDEAQKMMAASDAFASVVYGGREIAANLFLPKGVDLAAIVFPYAGGALASGGFTLREHVRDGSKGAIEALIVRSDPRLTLAEKAALRAVPRDQLGLNVGVAMACETTGYAVAALLVAAALLVIALMTAGCVASVDAHLDERRIKEIGDRASVRELLALRRDTILRQTAASRR